MTEIGNYPYVNLMSEDGMRLLLAIPDRDSGFCLGTRFDRAGVFGGIEYKGVAFSDKWYGVHDPSRHDCLTGPVEEFSQNGYDDAVPGELFVKPGVGLLVRDSDGPYDWFHRYPVALEGRCRMEVSAKSASFRQRVEGAGYGYDYRKEIVLGSEPGTFSIVHCLENIGVKPLSGYVYNHNFFTMGGRGTGPWTCFDFPFHPCGVWRQEYDSVAVEGCGFRFRRPLEKGETVYMSDIHAADGESSYAFRMSSRLPMVQHEKAASADAERLVSVEVSSDARMHHAVFWGIDSVACIEPHASYELMLGQAFQWTVRYRLSVE